MSVQREMRILIADDHSISHNGVRNLRLKVDNSVVGEATNGIEALDLVNQSGQTSPPGHFDATVDRIGSVAASFQRRPHHAYHSIDCCGRRSPKSSRPCCSVPTVLFQSSRPHECVSRAFRTVMAGEFWVSRDMLSDLVNAPWVRRASRCGRGETMGLTRRELEVIAAVVEGRITKILPRLFISASTPLNIT